MDEFDIDKRSLYLCTPIVPNLEVFVESVILGGVDIVQLREKSASDREILKAAQGIQPICKKHSVPFIINDRVDIALMSEADGVHVGQEDLPATDVRQIIGRKRILGLSTHSKVELDEAVGCPVDYVSVGPIEPTPTKPGRPGTGKKYLKYASEVCPIPFFVTGGVQPENVTDLKQLGATRFVVVRYLVQAEDPFIAAQSLRRAIG
ncbi:thiamine-phosphate pyrophosphorylase [Ferrithrix thermotolerans DSM 19514]|uniref:Thiamine-phosphate synthase n=1 Tax=Ferrithrix thermotolerans DSM 19514 TaxID=1121881 RepID=A0A1M4V7Y4_9ACTN|nr:thiamine phosphate synthase [Ferrithrix thermotolerans]SHE64968.1 thiamine-phosphate pyrophosphorylase [Ferrithrix thermotolerans DSM 19514]